MANMAMMEKLQVEANKLEELKSGEVPPPFCLE
jgi:hypothetical protein